MDNKNMTIVNQSRTSHVLLDQLSPMLDKQHSDTVAKMMALFRANKLDHSAALVLVSQLCVLDDLKISLRSNIRAGEKAAKELYGNPAK